MALSEIAEGSIVKLMESGTHVDFYVAKHNYESELNGAGRTLLVRKKLRIERAWDSVSNNDYAASSVDTWLNETYKNTLEQGVRAVMGKTTFYYTISTGVYTEAILTTASRAVFLLSITELTGYGSPSSNAHNAEGSMLPTASLLIEADDDFWTRSSAKNSTTTVAKIQDGFRISDSCTSKNWYRPCLTLPDTSLFSSLSLQFIS